MAYIEVERFKMTVQVTVMNRADWETQGEASLSVDVSSLKSLPKAGTMIDALAKAAVVQHLRKIDEKARVAAIPAGEEIETE